MTAARVMAAVVLTAVLSSCASIPQWSDNPQDCTPDPVVDVVTAVKYPNGILMLVFTLTFEGLVDQTLDDIIQ